MVIAISQPIRKSSDGDNAIWNNGFHGLHSFMRRRISDWFPLLILTNPLGLFRIPIWLVFGPVNSTNAFTGWRVFESSYDENPSLGS